MCYIGNFNGVALSCSMEVDIFTSDSVTDHEADFQSAVRKQQKERVTKVFVLYSECREHCAQAYAA
jgi:hypothetical protein